MVGRGGEEALCHGGQEAYANVVSELTEETDATWLICIVDFFCIVIEDTVI
jgi:hypothetical protein